MLAPPGLTIPALSPAHASGPGPGAVSVIELSIVLLAATIGGASLVLIRRSG